MFHNHIAQLAIIIIIIIIYVNVNNVKCNYCALIIVARNTTVHAALLCGQLLKGASLKTLLLKRRLVARNTGIQYRLMGN